MSKGYSLNIRYISLEKLIIIIGSILIGCISIISLKFLEIFADLNFNTFLISLTIIFFTIQFMILKILFNNKKTKNKSNRKETIDVHSKEVNNHLISSIIRFFTTIIFFFIIIKIYNLNLVIYTSIIILLYLIFSIFDMSLTLFKLHSKEY